MKAEYDEYGCPMCPDCRVILDNEDRGNRDSETMGGSYISYYRCEQCKERYELIQSGYDGDKLYPYFD